MQTPWFWTSGTPNCKSTNFCCFKIPGLCSIHRKIKQWCSEVKKKKKPYITTHKSVLKNGTRSQDSETNVDYANFIAPWGLWEAEGKITIAPSTQKMLNDFCLEQRRKRRWGWNSGGEQERNVLGEDDSAGRGNDKIGVNVVCGTPLPK